MATNATLRPEATPPGTTDRDAGLWTVTPLFSKIDDDVGSPDGTLVVATGGTLEAFQVDIVNPSPGKRIDQCQIQYHARKSGGGPALTLLVEWRHSDDTVITSFTNALTTTLATYTQSLTNVDIGEAEATVSYLHVVASGGGARFAELDALQLDVREVDAHKKQANSMSNYSKPIKRYKSNPVALPRGQMMPGEYYITDRDVSTGNSDSTGKVFSNITCVPITIARHTHIDRIGINRTAILQPPSATGRLGIYNDDGFGYPNDLLLDTGTFSIETTGAKEVTIDYELEPGLYWLAFTPNGTNSIARYAHGAKGHRSRYGSRGAIRRSSGWTEAGNAGSALPNPWADGASIDNQTNVQLRIFLRVSGEYEPVGVHRSKHFTPLFIGGGVVLPDTALQNNSLRAGESGAAITLDSTDTTFSTRLRVDAPTTFDRVAMQSTGTVTTSGDTDLYLYADDFGVAGARMQKLGTATINAGNTRFEVTLGEPLLLPPGNYWLVADRQSGDYSMHALRAVESSPLGVTSITGTFTAGHSASSAADPYVSTGAVATVPVIAMRVETSAGDQEWGLGNNPAGGRTGKEFQLASHSRQQSSSNSWGGIARQHYLFTGGILGEVTSKVDPDRLQVAPILVERRTTFADIGCQVTDGDGDIELAVYTDDGEWFPKDQIFTTGVKSITGLGEKRFTADIELEAGIYWLAIDTPSHSGTFLFVAGHAEDWNPIVNPGSVSQRSGYQGNLAMPTSFTKGTDLPTHKINTVSVGLGIKEQL